MKLFKKRKRLLIGLGLLISIFLAGCSTPSSLPKAETGMITGKIELDSLSSTVTAPLTVGEEARINRDYNTVDLNQSTMKAAVFSPSEYIIKFSRNLTPDFINREILKGKGSVLKNLGVNHTYKIELDSPDQNEIINSLQNNSLVSWVEPDYAVHIQSIPNDPEYDKQWNMKMLGLEKTWNEFKGSSSITVAVLDTGVLVGHPDLQSNIVPGYDFIDDDDDPTDTSPDFSHGTHVAGIIGAATNNSQGVAGVNWQVNIMPVRVIGPDGNGGYSALIAGLKWAADHGADVINLSLAGSVDLPTLREAIQYAISKGVTIVAAAGNNGSSPILYPARYEEVISVGAIGPNKKLSYYSNYGPNLDLVAPGGDSFAPTAYNNILSTAGYMDAATRRPVYQYSWAQGTSMATPHVAGLVALLYSSGMTNPDQIQRVLKETADDLGPTGPDNEYGAGLININKALNIDNNDGVNNGKDEEMEELFQETKIFTAREEGRRLIPISTFISPDPDGNFTLEVEPGDWLLIGWTDKNKNGSIDSEDYYGRVNVRVTADQISKIENFRLKIVQ